MGSLEVSKSQPPRLVWVQHYQRNFPGSALLVNPIIGCGGNHLLPGLGALVAGQYFGSDRDNLIMDLTNSNAKILLSNTKYALYPAWANGDVLIILARPTFFSSADEYWGINSQTGERLWKFAIPGQGRLAYSEVRSTAKGVFEVSCRADPNGCSWSALDPQTGIGTQTGQSSLGGASMRGTWDQDTLYLEGDQHLNVIDALSSQLLYQWP